MKDKKKPIKLNDQQLMLMADNVSDIYRQLCNDLFDNVVERLHDRGTYYLDQQPYLWQLEKMADVGMLNDHNIKLIAEYSGIAEKQIRYIIENEGYKVYKDTHEQLNSNAYDYKVMKDLISYSNQAVNDVHNLINTTLPKSVQATYKDIIETTVAKVITGMATPQKALDETIIKFQERGFYGYTDRAGRRQRADAYARTVIKTTARRTFNEMRMRPAQELGIDTFYYSIKPAAREMCAPLQHQIVTTGQARVEEGEKIFALDDYGYGKPGGCQGINCGHTMTPFIPGVNYKPDLPEHLANLTPEQAIENANAQAKQRALERSIRQSKEFLHVAEKLGDQELIDKYKSKVRIQQGAMRDYLKQHPFLHRDYAREKYYDDPYIKAKKEVKVRKELEKLEKHRAEQKEMRERFTNAVKDGIVKAEINEQKQADHIKGTNEWRRRLETELANGNQIEPSYLTISMDEAAKLIKRYSGTGKFLYKEDPDYIPKKEIIKHNRKVGMYIDQRTGEMFETDSFRIHYRKTGAHIVPTYGGKQ